MDDSNAVKTLLSSDIYLSTDSPTPGEQEAMKFVPYLEVVGSLQYLATMIHPDIAYAVPYLGRFNHNPSPQHSASVKHLLCYLEGSMGYKLVYKGNDKLELFQTYCNASHGSYQATG